MTSSRAAIAEAFSRHRFAEVHPHLADDVRWVLVGGPVLEGRAAVITTCEQTLAELDGTQTRFGPTRTIDGGDAVVVHGTAEYLQPGSPAAVVASCDVYEFTGEMITLITSYTVELDGA